MLQTSTLMMSSYIYKYDSCRIQSPVYTRYNYHEDCIYYQNKSKRIILIYLHYIFISNSFIRNILMY